MCAVLYKMCVALLQERAKWAPSVAELEKEIDRLRGEREAMKAAHREELRKVRSRTSDCTAV